MAKYSIKIGSDTKVSETLQKFKEYVENKGAMKEDMDTFYKHVESTVDDLVLRGKKLADIGSRLQVQQTIENPICNVLIDIDFGREQSSFLAKAQKLFKRKK